jgi:hypothetical protein
MPPLVNVIHESAIPGMESIQGYPNVLKNWNPSIVISREKVHNILRINYKSAEKTIKGVVADTIRIGWDQ